MKLLFVYAAYENLGVEYLSAALKRAGHEAELAFAPRLFDDHYTCVPWLARIFDDTSQLVRRILRTGADLIAFSTVTDDYQWALQVAREIRARARTPIVFGGVHPTSVPERVIAQDCIDYVVVGEGDAALVEIADCLQDGTDPRSVKNVWMQADGEVIRNEVRPLISELDSLPFPDKSLFYRAMPYLARDYRITTARGCPYGCTYCINSLLKRLYAGKGPYLRRRSVENVMDELRDAQRRDRYRRIQFYDDTFASDPDWLEEFARLYVSKIRAPFWCSVNPRDITEEVTRTLKRMGCCEVQMGVQTASEALRRDVLHRTETNEQVRRAIELFNSAGIKCVVDNIMGIPGETEEHVLESLRFYNATRPARISDYSLRYYPRTEIVQTAADQGLLNADRISKIEEGRDSAPLALGGTQTAASKSGRFHLLLSLLLILPRGLSEWIMSKRIYRLLPDRAFAIKVILRLLAVFSRNDLNAERYVQRYRHFLRRRT